MALRVEEFGKASTAPPLQRVVLVRALACVR